MYVGDEDKNQKVALALLCGLLPKKASEDTLIYIIISTMQGTCTNNFLSELHCCLFQMTDEPLAIASCDPPRTAPRLASFKGEDSSQFFVFVEKTAL